VKRQRQSSLAELNARRDYARSTSLFRWTFGKCWSSIIAAGGMGYLLVVGDNPLWIRVALVVIMAFNIYNIAYWPHSWLFWRTAQFPTVAQAQKVLIQMREMVEQEDDPFNKVILQEGVLEVERMIYGGGDQ
jgi:membrane protein YdbS with pleckstrin-like domain